MFVGERKFGPYNLDRTGRRLDCRAYTFGEYRIISEGIKPVSGLEAVLLKLIHLCLSYVNLSPFIAITYSH